MLVLGGLVSFYKLSIAPVLRARAAQDWQAKPCKIETSEVATVEHRSWSNRRSTTSTSYRANLVYLYDLGGHEHRGNQYNFSSNETYDYSSRANIVNQYHVGNKATCYVNPDDPDDAVLSCSYDNNYLLEAVPLILMMIGGIGLLRVLVAKQDWQP